MTVCTLIERDCKSIMLLPQSYQLYFILFVRESYSGLARAALMWRLDVADLSEGMPCLHI